MLSICLIFLACLGVLEGNRLQELLDPENESLTSFFVDCDEDGDRSLTEYELSACFGLITDSRDRSDREYTTKFKQGLLGLNPESFISLMDTDGDGEIGELEYYHVIKNLENVESVNAYNDSEIDLELRDGTMRKVGRDEFFTMMQSQMKENEEIMGKDDHGGSPGFDNEFNNNNNDNKVHENTATLDDLVRDNPEMAHFIGLARFAVSRMEELDHVQRQEQGQEQEDGNGFSKGGEIVQLRSLPKGGSPNRGREDTQADMMVTSASETLDLFFEISYRVPEPSERRPGVSRHSGVSGEEEEEEKEEEGGWGGTEGEQGRRQGRDNGMKGPSRRTKDKSKSRNKKGDSKDNRGAELRKFELHVHKDVTLYRYPHVVVLDCWRLNDTGRRNKALAVPHARRTRKGEAARKAEEVEEVEEMSQMPVPASARRRNSHSLNPSNSPSNSPSVSASTRTRTRARTRASGGINVEEDGGGQGLAGLGLLGSFYFDLWDYFDFWDLFSWALDAAHTTTGPGKVTGAPSASEAHHLSGVGQSQEHVFLLVMLGTVVVFLLLSYFVLLPLVYLSLSIRDRLWPLKED